MNALSVAVVWCMVQITLMSLLPAGLYLLLRRWRPAAAESIVLAGLLMVVILSLAAFSPWPRWTFDKLFQSAEKSPLASGASNGDSREGNHSLPGADRLESPPVDSLPKASEATEMQSAEDHRTPSAKAKSLWKPFLEEISNPPAADAANAWQWPEIVAILLFAAMVLGFLWLALGVFAVRRQRLRSRPVQDGPLRELIDVICAELSCVRPIEVRQSDELVTAATIGWLRPVLLLPSDWTSWTAEQCRAVLAHEIAHARSHDFLALLCGQLGLMLHFYHPIVHWLVNRLRLEQELAADAAAASISGGQRQYLTTIAELALSQQDRPLLWPARTFLPTRNTFLRRVAMLRDSKLHFEQLTPTVRTLTVSVMVLGGLLFAGLRGPAGPQPALADETKPVKLENILLNSGMEDGEEYPRHWEQGNLIEGVKYTWDKKDAFDDKASICIEKTANRYFPIAAWSQTVERKGDLPYLELSAQVKTKKMFKAILDVIFLDKNEQWISHEWAAYIGSKNSGDPPANHDWKKYTGTVKIPEGTAKICVALQDYGPGKVWFDDVQARYVKSKSQKPALIPKKTAVETPAATESDQPADNKEKSNEIADLHLLQQGWKLWQEGNMDQAIEKFTLYLKDNPKNTSAWNGLGWASFNSGKTVKAEEAFQEVIKLEPTHPAALNGLGQINFFKKKYEKAESFLLKAAPEASAAWWGLAKLYLLKGKFPEAEKWRKKIIDSGDSNVMAPQLLQAAKDKHLSDELRSMIEPLGGKTEEISAREDEETQSSGTMETLSYVGESSTDMQSWADSGFAVLFTRPTYLKSIKAVKLFGSRYGTPRPPAEKFHIYLLDEKQKVLEHILVPYAKVQRGDMKWYTFEFPAVQVPEKFYVALWFDAESTKGVYVGKDANIQETHSWTGLPDKGYHKVTEGFDWMIRAEVSDAKGHKPSSPKVKTYEDEDATAGEVGEISTKRIWNDSSGAFSLESQFEGLSDGKVSLKKTDGKIITVPLDRLSQEDQDFVAKQSDAKKSSANGNSANAKELSHDDGQMANKRSIGGGGHAVRFEVDSENYYVTSVSLHGSRYGEPRAPQEDFNVWLCDENFKPIATFHFPYGSFARAAPVWKSFKIKPTKVPQKFIVCFGFNPHQTKGVFVSHDAAASGNSLIGLPGQGEPNNFDQGDWLIRCKVEKRNETAER